MIAVALKFLPEKNSAPIVVASGAGYLGEKINEIALANGGTCEGAPGLRPHYHANYYGAYFRDTEGNKVGVVCHEAE